MTKHEFTVEVDANGREKRRQLVNLIDMALVMSGARITAGEYEVTVRRVPKKELDLLHCHAGSDGECNWKSCPQLRDGEPKKSGRHCPQDRRTEDES